MSEPTNNKQQLVIHSTWNESRNEEFPEVLDFRRKWQTLGFNVSIVPNEYIRKDIETLDREVPSLGLLKMFDNLTSTIMTFDVWRFTKLYLAGGIFADVDVEPLQGIIQHVQLSQDRNVAVLFEETNWPDNMFSRFIIPKISDYTELPAYGTCVLISPGPRNPFFLDVLREMHPEKWVHFKEPTRTLMSAGPGHVTRFVKKRKDVFLVGWKERQSAYIHHGFGTWKSWSPKELAIVNHIVRVVIIMLSLLVLRKTRLCKALRKGKPQAALPIQHHHPH